MKILKFLLIVFFSFLFKNQISFADEAKMIKGLEIFNETAGCAACHVLKAAGSWKAISDNTFLFISILAFFSPSMNFA